MDTTSGVVCDSLVDVLAKLYLTQGMHLAFTFHVQASEAHGNLQKQSFSLWT